VAARRFGPTLIRRACLSSTTSIARARRQEGKLAGSASGCHSIVNQG
jgi:hypothetical protein